MKIGDVLSVYAVVRVQDILGRVGYSGGHQTKYLSHLLVTRPKIQSLRRCRLLIYRSSSLRCHTRSIVGVVTRNGKMRKTGMT